MAKSHSDYRPDIDGLRAVAVCSVVIYHFGGWVVPGGFTGVDIFFVISGYLITAIIRREMEQGNFSFARFFGRRIRRIYPALLVMLCVSMLTGWLLFLPREYADLARSAMHATLGIANLYFLNNTGYFDQEAELQPLLHTWSLGVEEQYYLLWPVALLIILKLTKSRRASLFVIAIIAVLSFLLCLWMLGYSAAQAFYLPFPRAWELTIGSLMAFAPTLKSRLGSLWASLAGSALICWSLFGLQSSDAFPGFNALFATVGAALLIWPKERNLVTAVLSLRPMVFLGLISYSLYLWHWPVLVFFRHIQVGDVGRTDKLILLAVTLVLAVLSWRLVERPFRRSGTGPGRQMAVPALALCAAAVAGTGLAIGLSNGVQSRLPANVIEVAGYAQSSNPRRSDCFSTTENWKDPRQPCIFGDGEASTALWGDSHALALAHGLETAGLSFKFYGHGGCPPLRGYGDDKCQLFNDQALEAILKDDSIERVLFSARWSSATNRSDDVRKWAGVLSDTIEVVESAGKTAVLIYPTPIPDFAVPLVGARQLLSGGTLSGLTLSRDDVEKFLSRATKMLDMVSASSSLVRVDPVNAMCNEKVCPTFMGEASLYYDRTHISLFGSEIAGQYIVDRLDAVK